MNCVAEKTLKFKKNPVPSIEGTALDKLFTI